MGNIVGRVRQFGATLWLIAGLAMVLGSASAARAQAPSSNPSLEIYGFAMADAIADFNTNNPDWYDVARPSKLPAYQGQFGEDGHFYLSGRQTRFGTRFNLPTDSGPVKGQFEFDMYGVGADAGKETIRFRHGWGQWRWIGAGKTNSAFMDVDVFPNTVEYWGPNGMLFLRNPQVFFEPIAKENGTNLRIALEAPGASGDAGVYAERIELQNVKPRFTMPDLSGHYRAAQKWGYLQVGAILRKIGWDDQLTNDTFALSGHTYGWGISGSTNLKASADTTLRAQFTYGEGIQNYFNDAPIDVGLHSNGSNTVTPVTGKALPIFGMVVALDHTWNEKLSSAAFYSRVDVTNSDLQAPEAYKNGQYFAFNVMSTPAKNVMLGPEFLWLDRHNKSNGYHAQDTRIQFSFKYSFSGKIGG